jgi:hypothetical protein
MRPPQQTNSIHDEDKLESTDQDGNDKPSATDANINTADQRIAHGFFLCLKGRTDRNVHQQLDQQFFKWRAYVDAEQDKQTKLTVLSHQIYAQTKPMQFKLFLNASFDTGNKPKWEPWLKLRYDHKLPTEAPYALDIPYTLVALRNFNEGETIGVYMGLPGTIGGVDSGKPVLLGMHFIQHTTSANVDSSKNRKANVKVVDDCIVLATQKVSEGDTLLMP